MQEKRETRGEDEAILGRWPGERRSMLAKQRRWLERTRTASETTKAKDRKDKHRRSRLEKSSDGWAKTHKSREEGKVCRSCLAFYNARCGVSICKSDSRQCEKSILRAKVSQRGNDEKTNSMVLLATGRAAS